MATTVLRRSVDDSLGLILERTVASLGATSGSLHLAEFPGDNLLLIKAVGVERRDLVTDLSWDDDLIWRLHHAPDKRNILVQPLNYASPWAALAAGRPVTLAAIRLGGRHKWSGVMVLAWPYRSQAERYLETLRIIQQHARQVLVDYEGTEQRTRDFQAMSARLHCQEVLARTVAQDIANRLSLTSGALHLLSAEANLPPGQVEVLQRALEQVAVLTQMLEDLKCADRSIEPEPVSVEEVLEMALGMIAQHQADHSFQFEMDIPSDLPELWCERIDLLQVLDHLLHNAVRHNMGCPNLQVWLRARPIRNWIEFEVGDTGIGISPEIQPYLFEYGYRANGTGKAKGYGKGLWSCARIVAAQNGKIWVSSQPGQGARFFFTMPVRSGMVRHDLSMNLLKIRPVPYPMRLDPG